MAAPALTADQARLLWRHAGGWMLAATIVDPDYGISSLKSRAGGTAWPDGSHPELPYNHTWTAGTKIIGHNFGEKDTPVVVVSFNEIGRWARQVPESVKTELRLQFAAMADERNRNWCRCPYAIEAPNSHSEPCNRYHPTEDEVQRRRHVMAGLAVRQAEWVLKALGLNDADDAEPVVHPDGQLELFGVTA
ncbi:hypothetical protein HGK72_26765 [Mycolicibacterium fortuitum]|uniref:hypothetical protein n=1 Tax=Mycolicibacterium fortuitum TaxID=1766 RepID=UPI00149016EB|nr:hypothetical protein [Mycolicibacterium fortuitum]